MTGNQLGEHRRKGRRTQVEAAKQLGVSQTYLSLLESGKRPVTASLSEKAVRVFGLSPAEVPARLDDVRSVSDDQLAADLSALGYEGFSHVKPSRRRNPADVLLSALNSPNRDARLVEALPWVLLTYPDMPWAKLLRAAKSYDLQNRLGYVTHLARRAAEHRGEHDKVSNLERREHELDHSRLVREDTLCKEAMTTAERRWLETNRPAEAKHWNLLTNLSPEHLSYYER